MAGAAGRAWLVVVGHGKVWHVGAGVVRQGRVGRGKVGLG
jgi:hypothetical protein